MKVDPADTEQSIAAACRYLWKLNADWRGFAPRYRTGRLRRPDPGPLENYRKFVADDVPVPDAAPTVTW
jgi:hypothetical protein